MSRYDFRVKLDLYKYYNDVRRFCCVFVDGAKMQKIAHLKTHVTKLFKIKEPFDLLLNDSEYLPADEDIRILKENERIVVSPGTSWDYYNGSTCKATVVQDSETESKEEEKFSMSLTNKEVQTMDISPVKNEAQVSIQHTASKAYNYNYKTDDSIGAMTFHTVLEDTYVAERPAKTLEDQRTIAKSPTTEETEMTNYLESTMESMFPVPKRKRTRKRARKQAGQTKEYTRQNNYNQSETKVPTKPKIISSCVIPSNKHIRFNTVEHKESDTTDTMPSKDSMNGGDVNDTTQDQFSALLSLGQCAVPLTFTNSTPKAPKVEKVEKAESVSSEESKTSTTPVKESKELEKTITENGNCDAKCDKKGKSLQDFANINCDDYPIMTSEPQTNDIIGFKILKMGANYSPEISDLIIGEVLSFLPCSTCTIKIIRGIEEVQTPVGKFSLEEETEVEKTDIVTLKYAELIKPILLSASNNENMSSEPATATS